MKRDILNYLNEIVGELELPDNTSEEVWQKKLDQYKVIPAGPPLPQDCTFAVDRENIDQELIGTDFIKLIPLRKLWDKHASIELNNGNFTIPIDGVYNLDIQSRFNTFINVKNIEIAIFQVTEEEDDFWFTLKKERVFEDDTELHLGNMTQFDFKKDETYYIAVNLTPIDINLPTSCILLGSDDYTAWGMNYQTDLNDSYR
jgi:hypothetical protein